MVMVQNNEAKGAWGNKTLYDSMPAKRTITHTLTHIRAWVRPGSQKLLHTHSEAEPVIATLARSKLSSTVAAAAFST